MYIYIYTSIEWTCWLKSSGDPAILLSAFSLQHTKEHAKGEEKRINTRARSTGPAGSRGQGTLRFLSVPSAFVCSDPAVSTGPAGSRAQANLQFISLSSLCLDFWQLCVQGHLAHDPPPPYDCHRSLGIGPL